jgi:AP-4 complex subunit epsilon-1
MIRKKSVIVIIKFYRFYPSAIEQMDVKMKKALCDKDPSVMQAGLNYFSD